MTCSTPAGWFCLRHEIPMPAKLRVGDSATLPSGRVVCITLPADPRRPWRAHQVGDRWGVRREESASLVHQHAWQVWTEDEAAPLRLDEADAVALAFALNRVTPGSDLVRLKGYRHGNKPVVDPAGLP